MKLQREISDERERKITYEKKKRNIVVKGGGEVATMERGNISERLSIAAFYAN